MIDDSYPVCGCSCPCERRLSFHPDAHVYIVDLMRVCEACWDNRHAPAILEEQT